MASKIKIEDAVKSVYNYFTQESYRRRPFYSYTDITKRTTHALGITKYFLNKCLSEEHQKLLQLIMWSHFVQAYRGRSRSEKQYTFASLVQHC